MKNLKTISAILKVFKWLLVAIGALALVLMLFIKNEPIIVGSPLISIEDEQLQSSLDGALHTGEGLQLSVSGIDALMPLTWQLRGLKVFAIVAVFVYLIWILQIILNIVKDVLNAKAFRSLNITRLKHIAWLLILSPVLVALLHLLFLVVMGNTYELPNGLAYSWYGDIDFDFMVIGFLLYAISIAFGEGLKMKQEQELTI